MQSGNKSKTKWCIDPCGNNWSKDDNKIGQRLLEKMGWSKGKGLGKLEDGNPDHIKVSTKNDVKGLGFNGYDDVWLEHQQDFDEVLKSLNQDIKTDESSKKVKSLTERSQSSKTRVHRYKKFIAGKDLSNKSEKDLKCIFGKSCDEPVSTNSDEVFRPNCGSMNDYFAKKMAEKLNKIQNSNEVITKTGVEITVNNNEAPISAEENLVKTNEDNQLLNKKEKKKKIKVKEEIRVSNSNDEALPTKEEKKRMKRLRKEEENHEEEKRMKKKLKKESEILINNEEKKRKKKLKKEKREIKELTKSFKHEVSLEDVSLETSVVNRKEKKRKLHVEEVEKNLELPLEKKKKWKENTNNTTESQKKKKKRNKSNDEIINDLTEFEIESNEIKQKKTKKIKEKQVLISKSINPFEN